MRPWRKPLKGTQLYRGIVLPGPTFGFETLSAGLVTIDAAGREVMHISRANGLPSDTVYYAMRDREGALWLGLDNGVTRVETPSPVSYFNQSDGLGSAAYFAARIDGRLYLGLQSGAASLVPRSLDGKVPAHFEYIEGTGTQCWWFAKMTDPARSGPIGPAPRVRRRPLRRAEQQGDSRSRRRQT